MGHIVKHYISKYWGFIVLVCVFQTAQTLLNLYLPNMNASIIDDGVVKGNIDYIYSEGILMIVFAFLQFICSIIASFFGVRIAFKVAKDLRKAVFANVQKFSFREISQFGPPTLITRTTNDAQQVQQFTMMFLTIIISSPIMLVGGVIMALAQDVTLSLVIAVTIPVIAIVAAIFVKYTMPYFQKFQKSVDKMNGILREQITGIRVVRAFVREKSEEERFAKINEKFFTLYVKTGRAMSLLFPIFMLIVNLSTVGVMYFGGIRVDNGDMQIGTITAFITYMMYIMMSVLMGSMVFVMFPRASVSAKRITKVLKTKSTVKESANPITPEQTKGEIEFKDVSFRYAGAVDDVIHSISFTAKPGQTTAIIGSTGSGKSTILRLLPRLADATSGKVLLDGINVRDLSFKYLTDNIAVIPQKSYLFSGTVRDNMLFGKSDATDDEIIEALKVAQSYDFLLQKVEEENSAIDDANTSSQSVTQKLLDLEVSQGGTNFSGGQRQRLAIARALVKKAKVYQFDDSFSALDYITDHNLRQALKGWTKDSAMIIVAQRISTIRNADTIIVLDEGKIVGNGTHDELLANNQTYQEIVNSQLTAQEAAQ